MPLRTKPVGTLELKQDDFTVRLRCIGRLNPPLRTAPRCQVVKMTEASG
jgi:hypothetical protein